ncbi:ATP-dependent RNA helicase [Actinoplanes sp. URMC 104]|uniref:ATP-dependent RNA helicase n=1 Tax=Actinoplanes sp. URMC 104 TaxID=3423409 RepID=UPI003F1B7C76
MLITDDALPDLPIRPVLPRVREVLAGGGAAVLVAPPGTGKTTLVPLALPGRVLVAEPRRLAARAAARRMAALLGERPGGRVGYTVRGDRQVSRQTRVEVVTTGVLVRRLQRDPELAGVDVVILDECHERHLDTDLALAFLVEVRAALRDDLGLLATSATADAGRLSEVLGAAPVVTASARLHPVEEHWAPPAGPITPPLGLRVDPRLLDHVAATSRRALAEGDGDVLVFLPGAGEIDAVAGRLGGVAADVIPLQGRQPAAVQDAALRPGARRRVVLATAVAESSLTVPGVRAVVDAGLSRVPRMDHARGLGALATVPVSRAAAVQRAGRAGREAPGRVYRCWSAAQHDRLPAQPEPEIAAADLTGFALDLALWGHPDGAGLALPDQPPPGALKSAVATLRDLGAVDAAGRVTARGRSLADAGLHPRLARALLDGAPLVGARRAAEIVALLDDDRSSPSDDLTAGWRRARTDRDPAWRTEVTRLTATLDRNASDESVPDVTDAAAGSASARASGADLPPKAARTSEADLPAEAARTSRADLPAEAARTSGTGSPAEAARTSRADLPAEAARTSGTGSPAEAARTSRADLPAEAARTSGTGSPAGAARASREATTGLQSVGPRRLPDDLAAGLVVALAYPERVARVREPGGRTYLMAGGTAADLPAGSALAGVGWLAIASADRAAGARTARIRTAVPLDEATAVEAAATLLTEDTEIGWVDGDVVARTVRRLGAITLVERRLADPDPARVRAALLDGLRRAGLGLLTWSRGAVELRERLAFAHAALGDPWPDVSDEALLASAGDWLDLGAARRRADLAKIDVASSLRRLLPWSVAGRLDDVAPERLPVPSGSRVRIDYADAAAPVLAVKVQEAFGWRDAPRLADGRVPVLLHLLSPAGRPVAVTRDLASFWAQGYPQVRAELRGRYPRHPWPEDPTTAEPTRRTNPRSR